MQYSPAAENKGHSSLKNSLNDLASSRSAAGGILSGHFGVRRQPKAGGEKKAGNKQRTRIIARPSSRKALAVSNQPRTGVVLNLMRRMTIDGQRSAGTVTRHFGHAPYVPLSNSAASVALSERHGSDLRKKVNSVAFRSMGLRHRALRRVHRTP